MTNNCHSCGRQFESEHSNYVCDSCRMERIRKCIADNTSYPRHINDLKFLMERHDKLYRILNSHGPEGHQYSNEEYVRLMQDCHSFKLKYEICREALEYYAGKMCIQEDDVGVDVGYIARKKLKEADKLP